MKSVALTSALVMGGFLAGSVIGRPLAVKRDMVTEVVYVTTAIADAIVYVDQDGVPYLTMTVNRVESLTTAAIERTTSSSFVAGPTSTSVEPAPTPSAAVVPPASLVSSDPHSLVVAPQESTPTSAAAQWYTSIPAASSTPVEEPSSSAVPLPPASSVPSHTSFSAPAPEPVASSAAPAPAASAKAPEPSAPAPAPKVSTQSDGLGVTYDPYKGTPRQCQCKTSDEIAAQFEQLKSYKIVRIYGNDCGIIPVAVQQAKKNGQNLMAGIYSPNQAIDDVVNDLSDAINQYNGGSWDIISLVSVENERVNAHVLTASDAMDTVAQARVALKKVGYTGLVGAVETAPAIVGNPAICAKSDVALVNIHAFFDQHTKAEDAGKFVKSEVERVRQACPDKRVIVTESGWPHKGDNHDDAVASPEAQQAALASIRNEFQQDLFLFNAFDSLWKTDDDSTFNAEKYWGFMS